MYVCMSRLLHMMTNITTFHLCSWPCWSLQHLQHHCRVCCILGPGWCDLLPSGEAPVLSIEGVFPPHWNTLKNDVMDNERFCCCQIADILSRVGQFFFNTLREVGRNIFVTQTGAMRSSTFSWTPHAQAFVCVCFGPDAVVMHILYTLLPLIIRNLLAILLSSAIGIFVLMEKLTCQHFGQFSLT